MNIHELSIDTIGLSPRSMNALHRAEVHTVAQMLEHNEQTLTGIRNLGQKSIAEILEKIAFYRNLPTQPQEAPASAAELSFDEWLALETTRETVLRTLQEEGLTADVLETLPVRAYNLLLFAGKNALHELIFATREELMAVPRMDEASAASIQSHCLAYLRENRDRFSPAPAAPEAPGQDLMHLRLNQEHRDAIIRFAQANDLELDRTELPNRAKNQLRKNGFTHISHILPLSPQEIQRLPAMGPTSVAKVLELMEGYLREHEAHILGYLSGDEQALTAPGGGDLADAWDDGTMERKLLKLWQDAPFAGFNLPEMCLWLDIHDSTVETRLKGVIGGLLARKELEYVDYRCYRVYPTFETYLDQYPKIQERNRELLKKRLSGLTLEAIALEYGLTRERVRQIIKANAPKIHLYHHQITGDPCFDEDYYRYFYETYAFDRADASRWLGIPQRVWNYLEMMDLKQGSRELVDALDDVRGLDAGLRQKVRNYLNRNKLYLDGMWVEKKRGSLELFVARKFCADDVSYADFARIYNRFLEQEGIPWDEEIYYSDEIRRSRKNVLSASRFLLWKQNEMLRYYDIDGRDFSSLVQELNLDAYENTEISTARLTRLYPEVMEKYDIRDQYELHNLLRKILPEGSLHDFRCGRMPEIRFGNFDRNEAIFELILANAPISAGDLCALVEEEYGYDPGVTLGSYLQPFTAYYHQGIYSVDQKVMSRENRDRLLEGLEGDFFFIDELRRRYAALCPNADPEEINPYNLKNMGFQVLSRYVLRSWPSLESYFVELLTRDDIVDLAPLRSRYGYVQMFSITLMELKRNLDVIEFEPGKLLNFRKLERSGVTKQMLRDFCQQVWEFVPENTYFAIQSLVQDGFVSELQELGFPDWFYGSLLISDTRLSWAPMFNNLIFCKTDEAITIKSFETSLIQTHGSMDFYDLVNELTDRYGCRIPEPRDVVYKVQDSEIYYDRILDRLYANAELYYRELDETGGF